MTILKINDLSHYFGGLVAVKQFDLTLKKGEIVGLIGPNGAGKTTIFNLVSGFYRPTKGNINFKNQPIGGKKPHIITSLGLARTFQNIRLWERMTVLENLCISQHCKLGYTFIDAIFRTKRFKQNENHIKKSAMDILDMLQLKTVAHEYPKNLPYGVQRRVEIGRALTIQPELLMLDEPAAGMNSNEIDQLIPLVHWLKDQFNLTIWLIEHQMRVVMSLCQRICVLDFGEIIADGTPDAIRDNQRVIQAYLGNL